MNKAERIKIWEYKNFFYYQYTEHSDTDTETFRQIATH